ncbi:MAG TPA: MBG domain-containing protein [Acidimicrobiia bacterium]
MTVTADPQSKTYGDADPALTYQITSGSLAFADSFSGALTRDAGEDVSSYAITRGTLALSPNYDLSYVGANLTITRKPITVTADAQSKVYSQADPPLTYHVNPGGLVGSDSLVGTLDRQPGETAGTYAITQGTVDNAHNPNYDITFVGSNFTITQGTLIVTPYPQEREYGETNPGIPFLITGFANGEDENVAVTTPPVCTSDAVETSPVGVYDVNCFGGVAGNYAFSYVPGTLGVTPAELTVTADAKSRVYGAPNPAFTATITGFKNSENSSVLTTQPTCSTTATAASTVAGSPYSIDCSGAAATNYTFHYVAGSLDITQASSSTSVTLTGGTNPSVTGQSVTFTASVTAVAPSTATPAGTVQFKDGGSPIGSPVSLAAGQASVSTSSLSVATHSITAEYSGDANFTASTSAPLSQTVNAASTSLTITSDNPDPSVVNQSYTVNWTLAVTGAGAGTPTGSVTVSDGTGGSCTVAATASGSCSVTSTSQGNKTLTATYTPDTTAFAGSSDTEGHQVNPAPALTVITSDSPDPSVVGQAYQVGVRVMRVSGTGTPTGTVHITDNSGATCDVALSFTSDGVADTSCFLVSSSAGLKVLTATYGGDASFGGSSDNDAHTVNNPPTPTITVITSDNPDPSTVGNAYTIGVRVMRSGGSGTPLGNVVITVDDGAQCTAGLSQTSDGIADGSCPLAAGSAGLKIVTASYPGNANFGPSSDNEAHTVNPALTPQTITFAALPDKTYGDPAFTVGATGGGSGNPVTFSTTTPAVCTSSGTNGSTITIVGAGTCSVNADQAGNASFSAAPTVTRSFTVQKASLTVTADNKTKTQGQANPPLTATITGFVLGQTLGTSDVTGSPGLSTTATTGSPVGSYPITASVGTLASGHYSFSYQSGTLSVTPAVSSQTITFGALANRTYGNAPFTVSATASSGLPVTFSTTTPAVCTSSGTNGSTITIVGAGTCSVNANQAGNASFSAAPTVTRSFTVAKAPLTVTADNKTKVQGSANPPLTATITGFVLGQTLATSGVTGSPALSTTATTGSPVGSYPITVAVGTLASANYSFSFQNGTLTVTAATPKLVFLTSPQTMTNGVTSDTITIQRQSAAGAALTSGSLNVSLSSSPNGSGSFRNTNDSNTINSVTIPSGVSSVSFRYRPSQTGSPTLIAAASGFTSATQVETVVLPKLVVITAPQTMTQGLASNTITVQRQAANGTPLTSGNQSVSLSVSPSGSGVFRNSGDSSTITSVTISNNSSSANFRFRPSATGTPTLMVSASGYTSGTQVETVGTPKLVFTTSPQSATVNGVTSTISVQRQAADGTALTSGSLTVSLSVSPSGSGVFRNTGNTSNITTVTIGNNSSAMGFRFRPSTHGNKTITVSASGYTSASQVVTVP